ncbi:CopG family transcriptional regulator [Cellulomonas fimi]|uniref:ribbon-helix-helix domain-containing protein n=1 Tax=Cellulomonas sp. RIT-PI-Y TaxID=3035297 RepID=UPI0021D9B19A
MTEKNNADATRSDDAHFARLAEQVGADSFELGTYAVVEQGSGDTPGREYLAAFLTADELDAAVRRGRGRPRLSSSGAGRSPKRQVRLSEDVDEALLRAARDQGRTPSAVMRQAIEEYLHSA